MKISIPMNHPLKKLQIQCVIGSIKKISIPMHYPLKNTMHFPLNMLKMFNSKALSIKKCSIPMHYPLKNTMHFPLNMFKVNAEYNGHDFLIALFCKITGIWP
jgi:hypothetical protein